MDKEYYVYILASRRNGTLYTGVTADIIRRVYEHKNDFIDGFTQQHHIHMLVYYEVFADIQDAIAREKQIKNWERAWKKDLIEKDNPRWIDLYDGLIS